MATTRRVEFGDTDMAGILHFSNYFRFMEVAETDFLLERGIPIVRGASESWESFPRVAAACDYRKPARFGDLLTIQVIVEKIGRTSISYLFNFTRDGESIATGRTTAVYCVKSPDGQMTATEIPDRLRQQLEG